MTKKLKIQLSLFVVAILFNIWGILSILQVGIGINVGLTYLDKIKDGVLTMGQTFPRRRKIIQINHCFNKYEKRNG